MSCPTCDHTVSLVCQDTRCFACPRCGTIVWSDAHGEEPVRHEPPQLVERLRLFIASESCTVEALGVLDRLGIVEAVLLPDERPEVKGGA